MSTWRVTHFSIILNNVGAPFLSFFARSGQQCRLHRNNWSQATSPRYRPGVSNVLRRTLHYLTQKNPQHQKGPTSRNEREKWGTQFVDDFEDVDSRRLLPHSLLTNRKRSGALKRPECLP